MVDGGSKARDGAPATSGETGFAPLVTVVLPAYRVERYLRESLDSILAQSYPNFEVVVVDDASPDRFPELVRQYRDDRLRYYRNPSNLGIFATVNVGIELARGELIAVQHADDVYDPRILERQVAFLAAHPEAGAVFCTDVFIDPEGREFGRLELPPEFRGSRVLRYSEVVNGLLRHGNTFIRDGTSLVRRAVYEDVGSFDPAFAQGADLEMWLRIARRHPIGILDERLRRYRWGHDNASAHYRRLRTEPELTFAVMDRLLGGEPDVPVEPDGLVEYEGRRAEDLLRVAINLYILDRRGDVRRRLAQMRVGRILRARRLQRWRLLAIWGALHVLARLPRIGFVAAVFYRRWGKGH